MRARLVDSSATRLPGAVLHHRACCCWLCPQAEAGVCVELKRILPQRPCLIEIGIRRPESYCPDGHWSAYAPAAAAT